MLSHGQPCARTSKRRGNRTQSARITIDSIAFNGMEPQSFRLTASIWAESPSHGRQGVSLLEWQFISCRSIKDVALDRF